MKKKLLMVALISLLGLTACDDEQPSDDTPVNDIQSLSTAKPGTASPAVKPANPATGTEDLDTDIEGEINKDEIEQDDDFKEDPSNFQTEDEAEFDEPIMEEDAPSTDDIKAPAQPVEANPVPQTNQANPKTQK